MSNEEKLTILFKQINLPKDTIQTYFSNSSLHKLVVHKSTKKWHFHINIEKPLPFQIYQLLLSELTNSFQTIASVQITLHASNQVVILKEEMEQYWQLYLKQIPHLLPNLANFIIKQPLQLEGHHLIIYGRNEIEVATLKRKLQHSIVDFLKQIGLSNYTVQFQVKADLEDIEIFRQKTNHEDRQIAQQTAQIHEEIRKNGQARLASSIQVGQKIKEEPTRIDDIQDEERSKTIQGYVFIAEVRKLRSERSLLILKVTDYTDSIEIKKFSNNEDDEAVFAQLNEGMWIKARGRIQTDNYSNELVMMANDIQQISMELRQDKANENDKRVELHAHTTMSQLDGVIRPSKLIEQAANWGHEAIAITDHAGVQGFPEAFKASKAHDIKVIYGVEANVVDDGIPIVYNPISARLSDQTYVVFDVETTGLSSAFDLIIEIAGVKLRNGEVIDQFESFANPHRKLSDKITSITGITDDMLVGQPEIDDVLTEFHHWVGDSILVAHNASFDIGFLNQGYKKVNLPAISIPVIDTLELARFLVPHLGNHRLNTLCKHYEVTLENHHRALDDSEATARMFWKMVQELEEKGLFDLSQLNEQTDDIDSYQHSRPFHCTILAQNDTGLKNLYKLVSMAHINYFYRVPRIPRSILNKHREGLLIGSACEDGEIFDSLLSKPVDDLIEMANFYDYLEIQPPENYAHLIEMEIVQTKAQIIETIKKVIQLGEQANKPVVATGNAHYIEDHQKLFREILIASQKGNRLNRFTLSNTPFRTTDEMMSQFDFLGAEAAHEVVVKNSQHIASLIEKISPLKSDLYTPSIEGAEEEVRTLTYDTAKRIYGDPLPEIVNARIEKELNSIIGHGFSVIYLISHKLVKKSLIDGYLVGSRGSVGSSFVATMMEITEVNPLPAHYVCPSCQFHEFFTNGEVASGYDLTDKKCPQCDEALKKDGQDIPFETFLGFKGDKVPDIDLNFSGEYQPKAHQYTKELFGDDYVFRAGTIGTIANKTAYGYVKGYATDKNKFFKGAEIDRLVQGCTGVKRTTGQHPGGIIVVPRDKEIYDFTPIQYPADDKKSEWKTTHFEFGSIEDNLLKLDILGHDDPTVIRMLQDLSKLDPRRIPLDDEKVMGIFSSTAPLGIEAKQIDCQTGTLGVPEFGTSFVRQMLEETKPKTFAELVIISGLSHGEDVWIGNAQELIRDGTCQLVDVIGCRDDIMVYLMQKGLEASLAFKIMESVRKGRGLQDEWVAAMQKNNVPKWYIQSCRKIKYMFPKAHAAAYVLMAVRIAYFKVYHPIFFYAAYFSIRASDFELDTMVKGSEALRKRIKEIKDRGNDATPKERGLLTVLEVALEMCERGFHFSKVDLYRSSASEFIVDGDKLIPPFNIVDGLGTNAARQIVKARGDGEFLSKEDLRNRSKISKTVLENLDRHGTLQGMADQNQLSLF